MTCPDPINVLQDVIDQARRARKWSDMLVCARSVSDSDTRTLERVLRERAEIVSMLHELGETGDPFDHKFVNGDSLATRLRKYLRRTP
jgi:hypothetical protein